MSKKHIKDKIDDAYQKERKGKVAEKFSVSSCFSEISKSNNPYKTKERKVSKEKKIFRHNKPLEKCIKTMVYHYRISSRMTSRFPSDGGFLLMAIKMFYKGAGFRKAA